ncbi:MAG: hypothetical protein ACRD1R_08380 [Acidobacteriota bacterium]
MNSQTKHTILVSVIAMVLSVVSVTAVSLAQQSAELVKEIDRMRRVGTAYWIYD